MTTARIRNYLASLSLGCLLILCPFVVIGGTSDDAPSSASTLGQQATSPYLPQLLIRFKSNVDGRAVLSNMGLNSISIHSYKPSSRLNLMVIETDENTLPTLRNQLKQHPSVLQVEPNQRIRSQFTVNDALSGSQWGLNSLNMGAGWNIQRGDADHLIGLLDTGIDYTHPDFVIPASADSPASSRVWVNPGEIAGDGIDNDNNGYIDDIHGINAINLSGDPMDDNEHGTHVAGIMIAQANNSIGVAGINHRSKIIACKFLDEEGEGDLAGALRCMDYFLSLKQAGANIIVTNNSWGGGSYSALFAELLEEHNQAGMAFIAAAGNDSENNDIVDAYPANYEHNNVVSVAAVSEFGSLFFSNFGRKQVDIVAPGISIWSTGLDASYVRYSGTSMAAPHVAGIYSLLVEQNPTWHHTAIIERMMAGALTGSDFTDSAASGGRLSAVNNLSGGALSCTSSNHQLLSPTPNSDDEIIITRYSTLSITYALYSCSPTEKPTTLTAFVAGTTVTLVDSGEQGDPIASDGQYTGAIWLNQTTSAAIHLPNGTQHPIHVLATGYRMQVIAYDWITLEAAQSLNLGDDETASIPTPFPIYFPQNTQAFNQLFINSNGVISAHTLPSALYANSRIPDSTLPAHSILPYWDDLRPSGADNIYYSVVGNAPNRQLVIEWRDVPHYFLRGTAFTFQVVFSENQEDIRIQYQDVSESSVLGRGVEATIGYQFSTQVANIYSFRSPALSNQFALGLIAEEQRNNARVRLALSGNMVIESTISLNVEPINITGTHTIHVSWGDGSSETSTVLRAFTHQYQTPDTVEIRVSVTNEDGLRAMNFSQITIADLSLTEQIERARALALQQGMDAVTSAPTAFGLFTQAALDQAAQEAAAQARSQTQETAYQAGIESVISSPTAFGLFTQAALEQAAQAAAAQASSTARQAGIESVISSPTAFGLFTQAALDQAVQEAAAQASSTARQAGIDSVISSPTAFGLITQIAASNALEQAEAQAIDRAYQQGIDSVLADPAAFGILGDRAIAASDIERLPAGWTLLGTSQAITDMSIFSNARVIWLYQSDGVFAAYSADEPTRQALIDNGHRTITSIPARQGFWVLK